VIKTKKRRPKKHLQRLSREQHSLAIGSFEIRGSRLRRSKKETPNSAARTLHSQPHSWAIPGNTRCRHDEQGYLLLGQVLRRAVRVQVSSALVIGSSEATVNYPPSPHPADMWFCPRNWSKWCPRPIWWRRPSGDPLAYSSRAAGSTTWSTNRSPTSCSFGAPKRISHSRYYAYTLL